MQKEIDAQTKITQAFGREAPKAVADYAQRQVDELRKVRNYTEAEKWDEGGAYRIALHTVLGGLSGGLQGALGAGSVAGVAPLLDQLQDNILTVLKDAGVGDTVAKAAAQLIAQGTAAGVGGVASGGSVTGAGSAFNVDVNNRQLHPKEIDWIKANASRYAAQNPGMTVQEAESILAQQAFRQVQYGVEGTSDPQAMAFLRQAQGILPADSACPTCGGGKMFYATPEQKINVGMYADLIITNPSLLAFYEKNGLIQPTRQSLIESVKKDTAIRDGATKSTLLVTGLAGATALPPILSFCLSNPVACNQIVIAGGEIAAGDALGPTGLAVGGIAASKLGLKSVQSADEANAIMRAAGKEAAWSSGTPVINAELKPGTAVQMVVTEKEYKEFILTGKLPIGGWATFDDVTSQAGARQNLALLNNFKEDVKYVINYEVVKPITADIGFVGRQNEVAGGVLSGGGTQAAFNWSSGMNRSDYLRIIGSPTPLPVLPK